LRRTKTSVEEKDVSTETEISMLNLYVNENKMNGIEWQDKQAPGPLQKIKGIAMVSARSGFSPPHPLRNDATPQWR
jgi:hypothetical protein